MPTDQPETPLKGEPRPNDTFAFRGRISFAELDLARDIATLQLSKGEKQRKGIPEPMVAGEPLNVSTELLDLSRSAAARQLPS